MIENASGGTPEYIANGHQWIQEQYEGQIQGGNDIRECVSCSANTQMWGRDSRGLPICMNCLNSEGFNRMSMPRQPNRAPKAKAPAVSIYLNLYNTIQNKYIFHLISKTLVQDVQVLYVQIVIQQVLHYGVEIIMESLFAMHVDCIISYTM